MAEHDDAPGLLVSPCQSSCAWHRTDEYLHGLPVFRCTGCRSEWIRSEAWTPIDHNGVVPAPVAAEADLRQADERRADKLP